MVGSPRLVLVAAPVGDKVVMLWIALAAAAFPKLFPHPVAALVLRSSVRWRGGNYAIHLFHVFSAAGFLSLSRRSFGKEFAARSECVTKATRRSSEKIGLILAPFLRILNGIYVLQYTQIARPEVWETQEDQDDVGALEGPNVLGEELN